MGKSTVNGHVQSPIVLVLSAELDVLLGLGSGDGVETAPWVNPPFNTFLFVRLNTTVRDTTC